MQQVEPPARLADVLGDEVARVVVLEPLGVLERVVHLGERHRTGVEPDVEHVGDAPHGRPAGGVVRVRPGEGVDERPVQVGDLDPEVARELGQRAVHVGPGVGRVVADPDRDRGAPVAVARDRPVARPGEPVAELAVPDVLRHPGDLLVELDHPVPELGDPHEPAGHCLVDQGVAAAPAVRVGVLIGLVPHDDGALSGRRRRERSGASLEVGDDRLVRVEDLQPGVVGHLGREAALGVDRDDRRDPGRAAHGHVVLAEAGRHVHQPRAVLDRDEVGGEHTVRSRPRDPVREVPERRGVRPADQVGAAHRLEHARVLAQLARVRLQACGREDHALPGVRARGPRRHHGVVDLGSDGDGQVGRERPGRRGPDQSQLTGLQAHTDGQRRVLPGLVDVSVHPQLVVGQWRLVAPAVRQHPVALVGQALVVELLEPPDDRLHVGQVERLVVVVEVDPTRLARDVRLPLVGVLQHRGPAHLVERGDAHLVDLGLVGDPQYPFGLELGRQTVGVPAEPALDAAPPLRLVAPHEVLRVSGQQVAVVRHAVGERRPVVEDELVGTVDARGALVDRRLKGVGGCPVGQHVPLERGQVRGGRHRRVAGGRAGAVHRVGHGLAPGSVRRRGCHEDDSRRLDAHYRGTTPLAAATRENLQSRRPLEPAVTGHPSGSTGDRCRSRSSGRLTGDGRVDACDAESTAPGDVGHGPARPAGPMGRAQLFPSAPKCGTKER